jgi:hypothetical protein
MKALVVSWGSLGTLCCETKALVVIQGLSDPAPSPVHHPKHPVLGFHGWDEIVPHGSVYLVSSVFSSAFFFPFSHFFTGPFFFFFWVPPPLNQFFFWKLLPTPPTYLPPFHHPTHLPPYLPLPTPPPICAPLHH